MSQATIKITLPIPTITDQAFMDITLSVLPITIATIILLLVIQCCQLAPATSGPNAFNAFN